MAVLSVMALEGPEDKRIDPQTLVKPADWMASLPPHLRDQWGVTVPGQSEEFYSEGDLAPGHEKVFAAMKRYWGHGVPSSEHPQEWDEDVLNFTLMKLEMDLSSAVSIGNEMLTPYAESMGLLLTVIERLEGRVGELEGADDQSPEAKAEATKKKRLLHLAKELYKESKARVRARAIATLALFHSLQASSSVPSSPSGSPPRAQSPPPPPPPDVPSSSAVVVILAPREPEDELSSSPPDQTGSALPQSSPSPEADVVLTPTDSPPLPLVTSSPQNTGQQTASKQQRSLSPIPEEAEDMAPIRPIATLPGPGSKSKKKKKGKKSKGKKQSSQTTSLPPSILEAALSETPTTMDVATQTAEHEWSAAPLHLEDANQVEPSVGSPIIPANSAGPNEAGHPSFQTALTTAQAAGRQSPTPEPSFQTALTTAQAAGRQSPTPSEDTDEQELWNPWWNMHFHSRTQLFWQRRNGQLEATEISALTRTNNDSPCHFLPDCQQHRGTQLCWCPECRKTPRWCCCAHYAEYCITSSRRRKQDLMVLQYPGSQNPWLSSQHYVSSLTFPGLARSTAAEITTAEATIAEATTSQVTAAEITTAEATTAEATTSQVTAAEITTAEATTAEATTAEATTAETTTAEATIAEATTAQVTPSEVNTAEVTTDGAIIAEATTAEATTARTTHRRYRRASTSRVNTTRATTAPATAGDTTKTSKRKKTNKNKRKLNRRLQEEQEQAVTAPAEPDPEPEPQPALPAPPQELCPQLSGDAEVPSDPPSEDVVFSSSPLIPEPYSRMRRASWPLSLLSIEEVYPLS